MSYWLIKEEPTHYSYADLARDGRTRWDGVHNALALRHLRAMRVGDQALYYHTGDERACAGIVRIASAPAPDTSDPRPSVFVEVVPVRALERPVALAEIKQAPEFAGFDLVRIGRLSVLPVEKRWWERILRMARRPASDG